MDPSDIPGYTGSQDPDRISPMAAFHLTTWNPPIPVYLEDLSVAKQKDLAQDEFLKFTAFVEWEKALKASLAKQKLSDHPFKKDPYTLRSIRVQSFDRIPNASRRILFFKILAEIRNGAGKDLPGTIFLRGGSVAILMILRPNDNPHERYVVMTEQPRIPAGSLRFMEIPAGMLDEETQNFGGAAAREMQEETGFTINGKELIDMTSLALEGHLGEEKLMDAMYPSPGGCDEFIRIFLWEKEMERMEIEGVNDRLTGLRAEQENIITRLLEYERLLEVGARDGKTLAAWSLYEYLRRTGKLSEYVH